MVCFTNKSCIGYSLTDFKYRLNGVMLTGTSHPDVGPVAMFPGEKEVDVYVGTATVTPVQYPMMLGQYSVTDGSIVTDRTRVYDLAASQLSERIFHTGFIIDNYVYYIVGDGGNDIKILRVCSNSTDQSIDNKDSQLFRALYEVELVCGGSVAFTGASVVKDYSYPGGDTLVLTVKPSLSVVGGSSRVCTYSISDIDTAMDNSLAKCTDGEDRRVIWAKNFPPNSRRVCKHLTVS